MVDVTAVRPGTRVRVTRRNEHGTFVAEGVLRTVSPAGVFSVDGHGFFASSEELAELYGCEQTIETLA